MGTPHKRHISVIQNDSSIHEESAESGGEYSSVATTNPYLKNLRRINSNNNNKQIPHTSAMKRLPKNSMELASE